MVLGLDGAVQDSEERNEQADVAAVAEQLAMSLTEAGLQRMHARVLAAFLFSDRDTMTAHQLAQQLGASAGSISAAITMLRTVALIEQVPVPGSRRDHFRLRPGAWATLMTSQNAIIDVMCEVGDRGLAVVAPDSPAHARLHEMRDFYTFLLAEFPALLDRWRAQST